MLTEGGTMTVSEHYAISSAHPYRLAGQDCCRWHKKMLAKWSETRKDWLGLGGRHSITYKRWLKEQEQEERKDG